MKTIKFVGYLFYRYYSKGPRANIPYFSTVCAMTLLGFLHLMQGLLLFDKVDLIPANSSDSKATKWLIMLLVMLPIYLLMTGLFKKVDVVPLKEKYDYNWEKVFRGNVWLTVYIIISFALVIILAILKKQ
jgi:uncharacterized membrane protein HdeD (DUF308 family)